MMEVNNYNSPASFEHPVFPSYNSEPPDDLKLNKHQNFTKSKIIPNLKHFNPCINVSKLGISMPVSCQERIEDESWDMVPMGDLLDSENTMSVTPNETIYKFITTESENQLGEDQWEQEETDGKDKKCAKQFRKIKFYSVDEEPNKLSDVIHVNKMDSYEKNFNPVTASNSSKSNSPAENSPAVKKSKISKFINPNEQNDFLQKSLSTEESNIINNWVESSSKECVRLEQKVNSENVENSYLRNKSLELSELTSSSEETGKFDTCISAETPEKENPTSSDVESEIWETLAEELDTDDCSSVEEPSEWEMPIAINEKNIVSSFQYESDLYKKEDDQNCSTDFQKQSSLRQSLAPSNGIQEDNQVSSSSEEESFEFNKHGLLRGSHIPSDDSKRRHEDNNVSTIPEEISGDFRKHAILGESPTKSDDCSKRQVHHDGSSSSEGESEDFMEHGSLCESQTQSDDSSKRQVDDYETTSSEEESENFWKQGSLEESITQSDDRQLQYYKSSSSEGEFVDFWKQGSLGELPTQSDESYKRQLQHYESSSSEEGSVDIWKLDSLRKSSISPNESYQNQLQHYESSSSEQESIDFWKQCGLAKSPSPCFYDYKIPVEKCELSSSEEESFDFWKQGCLGKPPSPCGDNYKMQVEKCESSSSEEESFDFWKQGCLGKPPSPCGDNCKMQVEKCESSSSEEDSVDFWKQGCLGKPPSPCYEGFKIQVRNYEPKPCEKRLVETETEHSKNLIEIHNCNMSSASTEVDNNGQITNNTSNDYKQRNLEIGDSKNSEKPSDKDFLSDESNVFGSSTNSTNHQETNNLNKIYPDGDFQDDSDSTSEDVSTISETSVNADHQNSSNSIKVNYSKRDSVQLRKIKMSSYKDRATTNSIIKEVFESRSSEDDSVEENSIHCRNSCRSNVMSSEDLGGQTVNLGEPFPCGGNSHGINLGSKSPVSCELEDDESESCEDYSSDDWETVSDVLPSNESTKLSTYIAEQSKLEETYIIIAKQEPVEYNTPLGLNCLPESISSEEEVATSDDDASDELIEPNLESKTAHLLDKVESKAGPETRAGSPRQKKVDFDLSATRMQDFYEYRRLVKRGKYPKPFDAEKKPSHSVLKHSNPSPINPFFKRAYNINYWTPEVSTTQLIEQMDVIETDT